MLPFEVLTRVPRYFRTGRSIHMPICLCLLAGTLSTSSRALPPAGDTNRPLPAVRLQTGTTPPDIDGALSDPAWKSAAHASQFYDPQSGKPAGDQTDVFLLYDATYIYVGFYCRDSHPDQIVARETVRDAPMFNDDTVTVEFDPFLTYKFDDYARFTVNAMGTRQTQIGGGRASKVEWQGDWAAAVQRAPDGWTVEMRIPWSILPYPSAHHKLTMGLNFRRNHQRLHLESQWSNLGPQFFNEREGFWQGVEVPAQRWKPRVSLLPYLLPSAMGAGGHSQFQSGLDARYQPTPELTGVATLNPDFQSVEGAVESISFSRSEHFVPDKRPFFVEGGDYLGFGQDYQVGSYFDSERIQHVDTGIKLFGKVGTQTTVGLLGTLAIGQENNFVARLRHELSPTSGMDLIMLQHLAPGADNSVIAVGPNYRWGKWGVDGQVAQTVGPGAGGMAWTGAINLSDKNLFTTLRYLRVGSSFLDRMGFISFNDYKGWSSFTDWSLDWRHGALRHFELTFNPNFNWHLDGRPFQRNAYLGVQLNTRSDYGLGLNIYGGTFDKSTDFTTELDLGAGISNRFRQWRLSLTTGKQADLPYTSIGPTVSVRLFKKFDVSVGSFLQNYQGVTQQHIVTFNYELSPYRAWGGRLVVENSQTNLYLSYHNSGRRGVDTYFLLGDPNALLLTRRLMVKFVFAL